MSDLRRVGAVGGGSQTPNGLIDDRPGMLFSSSPKELRA